MKKRGKLYAIVHTGGAFDCSFGVGIEKGITEIYNPPPPAVRVCSSGSTILASFATAGQSKEGEQLLLTKLSDPSIVQDGMIAKEVDVDRMIDHISEVLKVRAITTSPCKVLMAATDYHRGEVLHFSNHELDAEKNWLKKMRISMAIPLKREDIITFEGVKYCDGDVGASIWDQVDRAFAHGMDRVIAVDNHSPWTYFNTTSMAIIGNLTFDPNHRKILLKRYARQKKLEEKILAMQKKGEKQIIFFSSPIPLPTRNFNNHPKALQESIEIGYRLTLKNPQLQDFFS